MTKKNPKKYKNAPTFFPLKNSKMTLNNSKFIFLGAFLNYLGAILI